VHKASHSSCEGNLPRRWSRCARSVGLARSSLKLVSAGPNRDAGGGAALRGGMKEEDEADAAGFEDREATAGIEASEGGV
jgi:hypothetical protein